MKIKSKHFERIYEANLKTLCISIISIGIYFYLMDYIVFYTYFSAVVMLWLVWLNAYSFGLFIAEMEHNKVHGKRLEKGGSKKIRAKDYE